MQTLESKIVNRFPFLGSSQNIGEEQNLSLTVKGFVVALLPFLSVVLSKWVSPEFLTELINAVFGVVGAVLVVWGVIRKFRK